MSGPNSGECVSAENSSSSSETSSPSAAVPRVDDATAQFVAWVRGAAPYIHAFRGRTFVVGFGGAVAAG